MSNQKNVMEFATWRESYALKNRNIYIIEKIKDEKTGKDKYLTFNEKTGKITQNQTYINKNGEYIGLKGEKPFYLADFKLKSEIEEETITAEEEVIKSEIKEETITEEKNEKPFELSEIQTEIIIHLNTDEFVENKLIAEKLNVSSETIRKEMKVLEENNIITRENGKAKLNADKDNLKIQYV